MIRHYLIAAWRNMAANRLISAIAIFGLAVGIAAALLMGLVVRNQMTFDSFIPGHARTYRLFYRTETDLVCRKRMGSLWSIELQCLVADAALPTLQQRLPAIESIARLQLAGPAHFQQGVISGWETFFWASPEFFTVLPLPALHGTLKDALTRPDTVVLTSSMARKYFGRDDVVGRTLTLAGYPMTVMAVLRDLPQDANSLDSSIFVSMLGAPPPPARIGGVSTGRPGLVPLLTLSNVYLRVKPGARITSAEVTEAYWSSPRQKRVPIARVKADNPKFNRDLDLLRLDQVNLWEPLNPGIRLRLAISAAAGALVLLIAAINFVNLMVAGTIRRDKEVGLRKACGGGRIALMLQFLSEAVIIVAIAATMGVALTEWLLPPVNAFLRTGAQLDWSDPALLGALTACVGLLALAIGVWPALILSGFPPVFALRGRTAGQSGALRNGLAAIQFAILIVLAIAAAVVWMQRDFATREALRAQTDQMLLVRIGESAGTKPGITGMTMAQACPQIFLEKVRQLPGVRAAVCSSGSVISSAPLLWLSKAGPQDQMDFHPVDPRFFALYGVKPVAGNLPPVTGSDADAAATGAVINMAAVRKLGFASPQAALGNSWVLAAHPAADFTKMFNEDFGRGAFITAVVPDFSFAVVTQPIGATLYAPLEVIDKGWDTSGRGLIHVRLVGRDIPETLGAIDRAWAQSGIDAPLDRFFLNSYMQLLYEDMTRDAEFFAGCTLLAIVLACLGLVGIAVSTAERRTKEIGVRKAMGAGDGQIVALLLWQFAQPVLWANVIAWPAAWWLMRRWLAGFAYHIDLHWWVFAGASLGALAIALATVAGQAFLTARAKPVLALRYE